jgi:metal-sulfur cluster biosynthetic enzyme
MDKHWAYCSACDRQVEVVIQPEDGIVCLEVGHTCTGALCPITDMTPEEMREALDRIRTGTPDSKEEE